MTVACGRRRYNGWSVEPKFLSSAGHLFFSRKSLSCVVKLTYIMGLRVQVPPAAKIVCSSRRTPTRFSSAPPFTACASGDRTMAEPFIMASLKKKKFKLASKTLHHTLITCLPALHAEK